MKKIVCIWMLALLGCSNSNDQELKFKGCIEQELVFDAATNLILGEIKETMQGERAYFSQGSYILVEAKTNAPDLYEATGEEVIRVFTEEKLELDLNSEVTIEGKVHSCLTGEHGLLTNDLYKFYVIKRNQVKLKNQ